MVAIRARRPLAIAPGTATHVPARAVVDLDAGRWSPWREYVAASVARIEAARARYGEACLVAYYGNDAGRSLDVPLGTITTVAKHMVVRGEVARMLSVDELLAAQSFPADYPLTGNVGERVMQVGNSVPPKLARHVVAQVMEACS